MKPFDMTKYISENKITTGMHKINESKHLISIKTPAEIDSPRVKKEIEALVNKGASSGDIQLSMQFTTDNPKKITDKFQVLKNGVFFDRDKKSGKFGNK